jgi:hypothetical protein
VHNRTEFSDYYAYDDGSAELVVASSVTGTQIASQFHANRADTLRGVRFFFPYAGQNLNGEFVIKVWQGDLDSEPVYVSPPWKPFFPNVFGDTLVAFTTYKFVDNLLEEMAIPLPAGDFFVGIEQTSLTNTKVGIGYDMNSPQAGAYQFFRSAGVNGTWVNISQPGALMIRPVLGSEFPRTTPVEEVSLADTAKKLLLFPNPATDELTIIIEHDAPEHLLLRVYDIAGRLVKQQYGNEKLVLADWQEGLYLLQLIDRQSGQSWQGKFSVQH